MCLYPRLIKNPKYKANKKNGGVIPTVTDPRLLYVAIGCKKCMECRRQKTNEWRNRLMSDITTHTNAKYYTLTFSDESLAKLHKYLIDHHEIPYKFPDTYELDNAIATTAVRLFTERWRKAFKTAPRHWLVTELGHENTEHIHLHGLIWHNEPIDIIDQYWQYGFTHKGKYIRGRYENYVNIKTINYIVKYVNKMDVLHQYYEPRILCSKGIGANYTQSYNSKLNTYNGENTITTYKTTFGNKVAMPIYWRNKIYNEQQREQLWLQQLNKNKRYVLGQEYDISQGYETYFHAQKLAQEHNKRLGYGSDHKNWKRIEYEKQVRIVKQCTRLANGYMKNLDEPPF